MSLEDRRPDPDALLALSGKEGQGKLRVFLGAAPGVGKTYAMLARARAVKSEGVDLVVGLVETHGRPETQALLDGLEASPRRQIPYRGRLLEEFDIDAALARKPQLILVDELAHTNVPDSRHPKRWQDVDELLDAGIDVWTTLNIQHLESLADVVSRITGVAVRETVPDRVLQDASDVILVDITPEELLQRLNEGKVYIPETARRATQNFFTPRNLTALRELALRRTAERVDDQMVEFLRQGAIEGPWATAERLLVCVGRDSSSEAIVRAAARLATGLNASWAALYVGASGEDGGGPEAIKKVEAALRLAERLGAKIERLSGEDLAGEVLRFARRENITQIVLGRSRAGFFARVFRRSFTDEIIRRSSDIAVHVVMTEPPRAAARAPARTSRPGSEFWAGMAAAAASVGVTVGVAAALDRWLHLPNLTAVFLLPVVVCAALFGSWSAVAAAIFSFGACDFFFIDPRYEFVIAKPRDLLALLVYLVVAMITGRLASGMRERSQIMRRRAQTAQSLFEFSRKLSAATTLDDVLWASTLQIQKALGASPVVLLSPTKGELEISAAWPPLDQLDAAEKAAARWALEKSEASGWRSGTLPSVRFQFRPLSTTRGVVAICGFEPLKTDEPLSAQDESMLASLLEQTAIAIDRFNLMGEAIKAAALEEKEKLLTALLASLSHDLRTPLASITAAVTSLRQLGEKLSPSDRSDLLASIEEEAGRLARFIANLLEMSRIEAGGLAPRRDLVDVGAVVHAVERGRRAHAGEKTAISVAPDLPAIRGDANLLTQVLVNLLDNAHKYGGPAGAAVHARREGDEVVVTVTDEGPGVKPADLERIFEKFYRGGRPDGRKAGTGLGLSICRGLVTAMGGTIFAQSPALRRRGTRIVMRFPLADANRQGAAA